MQQSNVNRMWKEALQEVNIDICDLYELYPDSKIDVEIEQTRLLKYDHIVFQFPFYWYSSPSLLKQYIDEVFLYGYAYGPGGDKLKDKQFTLAVTVGSPKTAYAHNGSNHFTLDELLKPYEATFNYVEAKYLGYYAQYGTVNHASEQELVDGTKRYIEYIQQF